MYVDKDSATQEALLALGRGGLLDRLVGATLRASANALLTAGKNVRCGSSNRKICPSRLRPLLRGGTAHPICLLVDRRSGFDRKKAGLRDEHHGVRQFFDPMTMFRPRYLGRSE